MYLLKKKIKDLQVNKNENITKAIEKINLSKIKILFVVDEINRLVGSITDGDIRRTILKKKNINLQVVDVMNKNVKYFYKNFKNNYNYKEYFKLKLFCIPVINKSKKILFYIVKNDQVIEKFHNSIFLMAGGKGSRLYPLTKSVPKPLLKINNVPIIERIIENFKVQGFYNFKISINYLGSKIKKYLEKRKNLGVKIKFIREKKFLGTAGSLSITKLDKLAFPIILTNSDLISNINYKTLLDFHIKNKADLTICVRNQIFEMPYGEICLEGKKVSKIIEKPISNSIVNAGVYVLNKKIIKLTKPNKHLMMNDLINTSIKRNCKILSFPIYENWIDVGNKDQLLKAKNLS
tara:strand:+ start:181 stop:1227 length:1047 start_codon:yes stop_codon:yes gene_type:complete